MTLWREVVRSGTWLYNGSVPSRVHIIRQNHWPYCEPGEDEAEFLNQDGVVFTFGVGEDPNKRGWHPQEFTSESGGPFKDMQEAVAWFEQNWGPVEWKALSPPWRFSEEADA